MGTQQRYKTFFFEDYVFDAATMTATFHYSFDGERHFSETVQFDPSDADMQHDVLDRCLELALFVVGTSYYKCFPTTTIAYRDKQFSTTQIKLINQVYRDGMSQFMFQNQLDPTTCAQLAETDYDDAAPVAYEGKGVLVLQSGGKDSLLLGELLNQQQIAYTTWYMTSGTTYPKVISRLTNSEPRVARRRLDLTALNAASLDGGLNGHVPVTFIVLSYALIDAVLHGENVVLAAIGAEGNEPHEMIGTVPVNHQWSKSWPAEQLFADYVTTLISPALQVGSPLRPLSELRIAELFEQQCWVNYVNTFSSCNLSNYEQGQQNTELKWCGICPKCANTFLLFSPFVIPYELRRLFNGVDLYASGHPKLIKAFKGLLGVDGEMKPLECVGEIEELRTAYHMGQQRYGAIAYQLPFVVPEGQFDYRALGPAQSWTATYLPEALRQKV